MLSASIFDFPVDQKHRFANFLWNLANVYALDQSAITFLVPIEMQHTQNKARPRFTLSTNHDSLSNSFLTWV